MKREVCRGVSVQVAPLQSFDAAEQRPRTLGSQPANSRVAPAAFSSLQTGKSRGFAFVTMTSGGDAAVAGLNEQEFMGRTLRVNEALPQGERGGGGGGGYGGRGGERLQRSGTRKEQSA